MKCYHSKMREILENTRILWESVGRPKADILLCKQLLQTMWIKNKCCGLMGKENEHKLDHLYEVTKRQAYTQNTFKWLEIGCVDLFGEKEIGFIKMWKNSVEVINYTILPNIVKKAMSFLNDVATSIIKQLMSNNISMLIIYLVM